MAKVVPDGDTLAGAYGRMRRQALVHAQIDKLLTALEDEAELPIPEDLVRQIAQRLEDEPLRRWDAVLREIVENDHQKATS
jgi:tRNA uridine 5-carbamoylmethylation protein Kti12